MYKLIITSLFLISMHLSMAQKVRVKEKYPFGKLTLEPAVGTRLSTVLGAADIQVSNLLQYNITNRLSFVAHTGLSFDIPAQRFSDVKQHYSYTVFQKVGIGSTLYSKRTAHAFFIVGGLKYNAYSGTLINNQFSEHITTKTSSVTSDYGMLYNLKWGKKKYFFSGRLYLPLKDGTNGMIENTNVEFGIGLRIR